MSKLKWQNPNKSQIFKFQIILYLTVVGLIFIMPAIAQVSMRIVSLAPSVTEILYELGLEEQIVGVSSYCDYPPEVRNKQIVGDFSHPVLENIVSLNPDIVFTAGIEQEDIALKLKTYGVGVKIVNPQNLKGLYESIKNIGKITNTVNIAEEIVEKMQKEIQLVKKKFEHISVDKKPTVFILLWHDPLLTAGEDSLVSDVVETAGGRNIVDKLIYPYSRYSLEKLIQKSPDYILVCSMEGEMDREYIQKIAGMSKAKLIQDIDPDLILRPSPRIVKGIKELNNRLYNEK